jgi:hypothetical protein
MKTGSTLPLPREISAGRLTLNKLAKYPIVTHVFHFSGQSSLPALFETDGLPLDVALSARFGRHQDLRAHRPWGSGSWPNSLSIAPPLLPRRLPELDAAIINTNYALKAKLNPRRDAIAIESRTNNPYGNVIAVRARDQGRPVFKTLVAAHQSDEIRQFILTQFDGAILPVF